jgi:glycosyltransferase involved in cell wall biosynthesis
MLDEKLEILVNNKQMRVVMGLNFRKLAEQEFSIEAVVKKHFEIYDALLEAN